MDSRLTSALRDYRARYPGQEGNHRRLEGWLLDHAPTERRAIKALVAVPKLDLHSTIEGLTGRVDPFAFRRMIDALTSQEGLSADLAEQAVLAWFAAVGLEPPDPSALRGPIDAGVVAARIDAVRCLHLALAQSELPLISQVSIESLTTRPLSDLAVSVWLAGAEVGSSLRSDTWAGQVDRLRSRQTALLDGVDVRVALKPLHEIKAPVVARFWVEVKTRDEVLLRTFREVEVVPPSTWIFGRGPLLALAAFVLREDAMVAEIVGEAALLVEEADPRSAPVKALEALRRVVGELLGIESEPAPRPRIAAPRTIVAEGRATSLDLQLLLAACLEHAGMPPLLLWAASGPALGLYLGDGRPALTETDDPELLARLEAAGALVLAPIGAHVLRLSEERAGAGSFAALDLAAARRAGVLPLDGPTLDDGRPPHVGATDADLARQRLLDRAALAGARTGALLPGAWGARLARRHDGSEQTPPRVQTWKRRLLDLTLNNPLLNLRQRVTSLPLLAHAPGALESALASGQVLRLAARPATGDVTQAMIDGALAAGGVLVDLPERRVATQAKNALRAFRAALDEGGVHTLFLALGSLAWSEGGRAEAERNAPLLLVPVLIRRARAGHFEIKKADQETELNAALLEFLRREHGVDVQGVDPLPADHAGVDVDKVFSVFRRALAASPSTTTWRVEPAAQIGVFAFAGFRMWRDLDHQAEDLLRHPLVKRLALGGDDGASPKFLPASSLDEKWPPRDVLCPLEADASQLSAILAAADGGSFVLEGPPGTGKSQTIANLIAQCLATGKSVLFVSQKRAALDVVQARLEAVGLGPFVLELHSKKASKPEFIQQLRLGAEFRAKKPPKVWSEEADVVGLARGELNAVVHAMHGRREPGLSVYQAIADFETKRESPRLEERFDPGRAFEAAWVDSAKGSLTELAPCFERLAPGWEDLDGVRASDWPKARRDALEVELDALSLAVRDLEAACLGVAAWLPDVAKASADDLELADVVLAAVETSPHPKLELLRGGEDEVEAWLSKMSAARARSTALADRYLPSMVDKPLEPRLEKLRQWSGVFLLGWLVLLAVRWFFRPLVTKGVPPNASLIVDAESAVALKAERDAIAAASSHVAEKLGAFERDAWGLPIVDAARVRELTTFTRGLRKRAAKFPAAIELAADGAADAAAPIRAFRAAYAAFTAARAGVVASLDLAGGLGKPAETLHLAHVTERASILRARAPMLRDWGAYRKSRDACVALGLGRVVRALEKGDVASKELVEAFSNGWLAWWIDQRVSEDKALASFDGLKQTAREARFAELDRALRELARHEVMARLAEKKPRLDEGAPPNSQAGILLRQFSRRVGFASPRQLFSECSGLIRQLKPCVLMSPQSVAQYLDPEKPPFDVVVFDEASQVPTHEAIGAIARGRQVIVVGDSKQLPPTSFFLGMGKEEGDGEEVLTELDSILEECSASGLPSLGLAWHYRSRHPSLIAFSNARYYGSRLQLLPAAHARAAHLGVSRVLCRGAAYDRGGTATNVVEARALVTELVRRLRDPLESRRTIGAVTFSRAQQALVEDLLEEARERHPELEPFFDPERPEPVIVKNLENIQGDERDVVLFSIGYGPDAKGRMTANMGPLGQLGGERRLNVAVTRAREQLVVFVSFEPEQLDLSASAAQGLHDLKAFLASAAAGGEALVGSDHLEIDPAEASLKRALAERLEAAGHAVDLDVGVGRYRIDIAVRNRRIEGAYVLGIEVDGLRYAATETARDRERLRWDVLATLGWRKLVRARALDWYEDKEAVVVAALNAIDEAERAESIESTPPPPVVLPPKKPEPQPDVETQIGEYAPEAASREVVYRSSRPATSGGDFAWTHPALTDVLLHVIAEEGPIAERVLARRIADAWGLKRAPSGIATHAPRLLSRLANERRPIHRDGFFWPRDVDPGSLRTYRVPDPADPSSRREIEDIPLEEIVNAAEDLVVLYGRMPREDLARAIAKRFGFRGLTRVVGARVELAIDAAAARQPGARSTA